MLKTDSITQKGGDMRFFHINKFLIFLILLIPLSSLAQLDYPTKPIQMFIGFPAGGSVDILSRALVNEAKKYLGQEIVIINKPGAAGTVAAIQVVNSKPDGYIIGGTTSSGFTVTPNLQTIPVDLIKESTPIISFAKWNVGILVKSDSPFNTLKDFLEFAKKNPGKATYGFPGAGTIAHLVMEMIALHEGVKINFVAFPGDVPTATALLGGHIMVAGFAAGGWIPHVNAGSLRLLAMMEDERMDLFPNITTIRELGYPYTLPQVAFIYGPKGLSEFISKKLESAFDKAIDSDSYKKVAVENGLYPKKIMLREELTKFLHNESEKTKEIIKKLGLGKK